MKTIWKFNLKILDLQVLQMPKGAEILTAQFQGGELRLWATVDDSAEAKERHIEILGTGNPIPMGMGVERKYIATAQPLDMPLVWHVFERL